MCLKLVPYTCLEGVYKGKCGDTDNFWPANGCNYICINKSNPEPVPPQPKIRDCNLYESQCDNNSPFTFLDGINKGHCNQIGLYWSANGCGMQCRNNYIAPNPPQPMIRECNENESKCPMELSFTCLEGVNKGSCNQMEDYWPANNCFSQCKNNYKPSPIPEIRKCNPGESQCPDKLPYICLEGTSKNGCYKNADFWPTVGCNIQCKKNLNPGPEPPKKNVRECVGNESLCSKNIPYTCLEGENINGCHRNPDFWPTFGCNNQCKKI